MLKELRRYRGHLAGRGGALTALFALGLLASASALASPLLGKAFVDAVSSRQDFQAIPWIAGALLGLAVGDLFLGTLSRWVHARLSANILADLRGRLFQSCLLAPLESIEALRHGDLLTRFGSDLPRIQILLVDGLLGALQNLIFLAVAAAILLRLSWPLALWSFAGVTLAVVAAASFRRPVEAKAGEVRGAMAEVSHFLSERLAALRPIRFHRAESEEQARFSAVNRRLSGAVVSYQLLDSRVAGVPGLLLTLALAWIYLLGGRLLQTGQITLGTFVAFVLYQGRLFSPAQGILSLVRNLQEARVSLARVGEVLEAVGEPPQDGSGCIRPEEGGAIVVEDLTYAYAGKEPVLRQTNLRLTRGERIAIFGSSGAGKSTLLQLLFGLRTPASGAIRIDGLSPEAYRSEGLRDILGYAGSEPFLLHASVEENLRYGNADADPEALTRAACLAEADGFIRNLPQGYQTVIGGRGLALSDGQRQRLALARLFLRAPTVLVLDEAFSALDLETEARIRKNLWEAFPNRTVIAVSHRPVGLDDFDRILYLREGALTPIDPRNLSALLSPGSHHGGSPPDGRSWARTPSEGDHCGQDPSH